MAEEAEKANQDVKKETPLSATDIPETSCIRGIKYLSCQGGGMKGIGYVGAIRELDNLGVLPQLEEVAGSSAGGIFALMIAIGCTADELEQEMLAMDFRSFQDKRALGWVEASKIKHLLKGAADLTGSADIIGRLVKDIPVIGRVARELTPAGLLRRVLKTAEKGVSIAEKGEDIVGLALGSELGLWEGDALTHFLANLVARKTGNPNITFRELAALGNPFKKLTLTGSNLTTGKLEYYNAQNTPDMPIIQAARISASFPGAYKPVIVDRKDKEGKPVLDKNGNVFKDTKVDGGLLENLPDVFNKEPYTPPDPNNGLGGNRYAFALSFTSQEEEKPKKIKSMAALGTAMYEAKSSEESWKAKYGNNIASIDTVGMGTLDFDAPEERKQELIASGSNSVRKQFTSILENENEHFLQNKGSFSSLPIEERFRIKVSLEKKLEEQGQEKENNAELIAINRSIEDANLTEDQCESFYAKALQRYNEKAKIKPQALSDIELSSICAKKREELNRINKELQDNIERLELAKAALDFNRTLILKKYSDDKEFVSELKKLNNFDTEIDNASVGNKQEKKNELKKQKKKTYKKLIQKYEIENPVLADFFRDLQEDSRKPGFKVPVSEKELSDYCAKDIDDCEGYIKEAREELEKKISESSFLTQYQKTFEERTDKSSHYRALNLLNKELNKTINRRTTVLTKINHFLLKKAPRFERAILTFSKAAAFLSFVCWLPLAMPAVGIAEAISHFSSNQDVKATAENVIDFFSLTDVESENRLQKLREVTAALVVTMNDDYAVADKSEITCLHQLCELYFENSGIKIEDVFLRNPGEDKDEYQQRILQVTQELSAETQKTSPANKSNQSKKTAKETAANLESFRMGVSGVLEKVSARREEKFKNANPSSSDLKNSQLLAAQLKLKPQPEDLQKGQTLEKKTAEVDELQVAFKAARKKQSGSKHGKVHSPKPKKT